MGIEYVVKEGQTEVEAYQEALAEFTVNYWHGCPEGKAQFLADIGLRQPHTPYKVTCSVVLGVPGSAVNDDGYLYVPSQRGVDQGYGTTHRSGRGLVAVRNLIFLALTMPDGDKLMRDSGIVVHDTLVKRVA